MLRLALLFLTALALPCAQDQPLQTLRKQHPRLIALDSDIERVRSLIRSDARAKQIYDALVKEAAKIEVAPTVEFKLIGPRLLDQSRRALERVYTLALLYRIDGNKRYRDRAVKELRAAAGFPNWNTSHFLDTAEMTHAMAIGYDWLYPALTPEERGWMRAAIVEKGLDQAMKVYAKPSGWHKSIHNWNQVCNGGISIGALAIGDAEPEKSTAALREALASIPLAMASYAPDGGWPEGPGYWHYATRYNVYFLAALETALGTDFGLSKLPGFDRAGHFRVYFSSPSGSTFNYADASASVGNAAEMFWLARRFSQPVYSWQEQELIAAKNRPEALDLLWYRADAASPKKSGWPLDDYYKGVQVAFLRSAWDDPNAIFVGIKGGDNKAGHSHLDLGSFVLDAGGERWAADLGGDNYNLPAYFGNQRWNYYRLRTESHNTVLIDGENQDPKAAAPIVEHSFQPDRAFVRIDMSKAYAGKLTRYERSMSLVKRSTVVVEDVIEAPQPVEALWGMLTAAEVKLDGRKALLTRNGKTLTAEIRSPREARFDIVSTAPPSPQNQNEGTRKLVVRLPAKTASVRIEVALTPGN
jgi:hypothetical protein